MKYYVYTDGSIEGGNPGGWGVGGWIIKSQEGEVIGKGVVDLGSGPDVTNNQAEFKAILSALKSINYDHDLIIYSDSKLAVNILSGEWNCHNTGLSIIKKEILNIINNRNGSVEFKWIPRSQNEEADTISRSLYRKD